MTQDMSVESGNTDENGESEPYAEGSVLTALLGDGPKVKILAALLSEPDNDFNVTDISRLAGVSRNTVYRHLDDLMTVDVVKHNRDIGDSHMYKINRDSKVARKLAEIEWDLIDTIFE